MGAKDDLCWLVIPLRCAGRPQHIKSSSSLCINFGTSRVRSKLLLNESSVTVLIEGGEPHEPVLKDLHENTRLEIHASPQLRGAELVKGVLCTP
jgi:hypothetical protein